MPSPQEGRVRGLYLDCHGGNRGPKRGDRLSSGKSLYWVLHSRIVKRRVPTTIHRYQMRVIKNEDIPNPPILKGKLLQSAMRRDASLLFEFSWYPRKHKTITFEQYMREGCNG